MLQKSSDNRSPQSELIASIEQIVPGVGAHSAAVARVFLSIFPVGSAIATAWSEFASHRSTERIHEFLQLLAGEIGKLKSRVDALQSGYLKESNVLELLEMTIESVRRESSSHKRSVYASVLARLFVDDAMDSEQKTAVLESLDYLSTTDLAVFNEFKVDGPIQLEQVDWSSVFQSTLSSSVWPLACSLARLAARGLILQVEQNLGPIHVIQSLSADQSRFLKGRWRILPIGVHLRRQLNEE